MIAEMLKELIAIPEQVWDSYAFSKEPLKDKISVEQKDAMISLAHETGKMIAYKIKSKYPGKKVEDILRELSLIIKKSNEEYCSAYTVFAYYTEPNQIELFYNLVDAAERILHESGIYGFPEKCTISEILLAHELFHYCEYKQKDLAINQKLVSICKFGFIPYKTRLISLGEIAAMEFAKTLLNLSFSPYVLDVLLIYPQDKNTALSLYEFIKKLRT